MAALKQPSEATTGARKGQGCRVVSFTHYCSPTSSRETSTMKHGGGQQRVRVVVVVNCFCCCCSFSFLAGSNVALPVPEGRVVV